MDVYREAGLPDGVINLIFTSGPVVGEVCLAHRDFAGLHFTGSFFITLQGNYFRIEVPASSPLTPELFRPLPEKAGT